MVYIKHFLPKGPSAVLFHQLKKKKKKQQKVLNMLHTEATH